MMRCALPVKLKLEVTLRYLATGDSFKTLHYIYRVGKSTICEFLPEVLHAIFEKLQGYIKVKEQSYLSIFKQIKFNTFNNKQIKFHILKQNKYKFDNTLIPRKYVKKKKQNKIIFYH